MSAPQEPLEGAPSSSPPPDPQVGRDARAEPLTGGLDTRGGTSKRAGASPFVDLSSVLLAGASVFLLLTLDRTALSSVPDFLAAVVQVLASGVLMVSAWRTRQRALEERARAAAERAGGGLGLRARGGASCPLCKVALGSERASRCAGCGTEVHVACTLEMGGCSTLGCPTRPAPRRRA